MSLGDDLLSGKVKLEFGNIEHIKAIHSLEERGFFGSDDLDPVYRIEITRSSNTVFYIQAATSSDAEDEARELVDDEELEIEIDSDELSFEQIPVIARSGIKIIRSKQKNL